MAAAARRRRTGSPWKLCSGRRTRWWSARWSTRPTRS
uniref:Uncharacterized protein n=1 Tax=Arundo donax TaxID=35708 RepID=A0A0A8YW25_ARUDO